MKSNAAAVSAVRLVIAMMVLVLVWMVWRPLVKAVQDCGVVLFVVSVVAGLVPRGTVSELVWRCKVSVIARVLLMLVVMSMLSVKTVTGLRR